jgi:hypothetical protein
VRGEFYFIFQETQQVQGQSRVGLKLFSMKLMKIFMTHQYLAACREKLITECVALSFDFDTK